MDLLFPDVELQRLVFDAAAERGVAADAFVWEFTGNIFKRFLRESLHEPRLALTLALARDPAMEKLLVAAAERNRLGACEYVWDVLLPQVKDFLAVKSAAPSAVAAL